MLKNKFKIIAILMVIILCLMVPIVRAENEDVATNDDVALISEDAGEEAANTSLPKSEPELKKEDVYLAGDDITVDYIVDGNLFIFADNVTINSQIGGDAFIFAKNVTISETGYIYSNLFTIAQDITISGTVYDLYTLGQDVTINGYVYRDIKVASNALHINGLVGRNAFVFASTIDFFEDHSEEGNESAITAKGIINGDLNYTSNSEISIPEGAVTGSINFTEVKEDATPTIQSYLLSLGRFIATVLIIWLLCLWITPKFLKNTNSVFSKKMLPIVGYGILTPIVATIAFIILLAIEITSSIALISLLLLFILLAVSTSIFVIAINNLICNKLKIEKTIGILGMLILTSAIYWGINLVPYLGGLLSIVAIVVGLGIIMTSIIPHKNTSKKEKETKK